MAYQLLASSRCPIRISGEDAECPIRIVFCPIMIGTFVRFRLKFATSLHTCYKQNKA